MSTPVTGLNFKVQQWCERCHSAAGHIGDVECFCGAQEALAALVELKRMKDTGGTTPEYERQKLLAWKEAFRVCGVIGEPKP